MTVGPDDNIMALETCDGLNWKFTDGYISLCLEYTAFFVWHNGKATKSQSRRQYDYKLYSKRNIKNNRLILQMPTGTLILWKNVIELNCLTIMIIFKSGGKRGRPVNLLWFTCHHPTCEVWGWQHDAVGLFWCRRNCRTS